MKSMTRRQFLQWIGISTAGVVAASCVPQTSAPTLAPSPVPVPPTAAPSATAVLAQVVAVLRLAGGDYGYPSPFTYSRGPGYVRMSFVFDTLIWKDSQGVIPWLATEWKMADDAKACTFTLRDGVKWHDGQPLTVEDVAFTFNYAKTVPFTSPVIRGLEFLGESKVLNDHQVQIGLTRPYSAFLSTLGGAQPILPKHIWEKVTDALKFTAPEAVVGSGPYKLTSYDKTTGAYLYEVNPNFWLGMPAVRRIELVPVADELLALSQGTLDAAGSPNEGILDEVLVQFQKEPYAMVTAPGEWNPDIHFNLTKGAPYDNVNFRRAMAYAIDRTEFVKRILQGKGDPGNMGWLAYSNPYYNPNVEQYKYDLAKAKALLDDAGYKDVNGDGNRETPDGKPLNLPIIFPSPAYVRVAELIRDLLKAAGIAVTLKPTDSATMDALTAAGNYELAITNYGGLGADPEFMRQIFSSKSPSKSFQRVQGYANPRFDDLAEQQVSALDEAKRKALIFEMQAILAQDVPVIPLYYPTRYQIYRKSVYDAWYFTPGGIGAQVPVAWNKQGFVTGQKTGTKI